MLFRLALVLVLYTFLVVVVLALWRDLNPVARRRASRSAVFPASQRHRWGRGRVLARPNIEVVQAADTRLSLGELIALSDVTTIGRESDNDLVVDEDTVSSYHARLSVRDGAWWIEDLRSTNGTMVNDARLAGPKALHAGDVIQLGRIQLRFSG